MMGLDNGLLPVGYHAITWHSASLLFIVLLGTNYSEILIKTLQFSYKKINLKMSSAKWPALLLDHNILMLIAEA